MQLAGYTAVVLPVRAGRRRSVYGLGPDRPDWVRTKRALAHPCRPGARLEEAQLLNGFKEWAHNDPLGFFLLLGIGVGTYLAVRYFPWR